MVKKVQQVAALARRIGSAGDIDRGLLEQFRQRYGELSPDQRHELYRWLAAEFEIDRAQLEKPILEVESVSEEDRAAWNECVRELRRSIASPRQRLLEGLINSTGGMQFVFELRAQVLDAQRSGEAGLEALEEDIAHLLNRWCQHGLLALEEINHQSSYQTVQFLKERELVHPMVNLDEMGLRLGADRMCFALYHVALPEEPVIFIEVALSRGLIRSIHDVIGDPQKQRAPVKSPDAAIFYSINNAQNGLAGLGLGKVLVLRVTEALRERHPSLKTYSTLSPIPGLWHRYLRPILEGRDEKFGLKRGDVADRFSAKARQAIVERRRELEADDGDFEETLLAVLTRPDWIADPVFARNLEKALTDIAYRYIAEEKDARGKPLNPVAGFHLGNGAKIARANVNFAANVSERGLEESCGMMVNYVYSQRALAPIGRAVRSLLPWGGR